MKTPLMIPASEVERAHDAERTVIQPFLEEEKNSRRFAVRDILRSGFDEYLKTHSVSLHKQRIIRALMACGTGELGYTILTCCECSGTRMYADKCGNRYCPSCGFLRQLQWKEQRLSECIEGIPYYHVVFTLPHELNSLIYQNQRLLLNHLFRCAKETVLSLSAARLKMTPGLIMELHPFGSAMILHYHIHMLVSGGGLSLDKKSFRTLKSPSFFLPVKALKTRFRKLFLEGIKRFRDENSVEFTGDAEKYRNSYDWKELLNTCYEKEWNIEIKKYSSYSGKCSDSSRQVDSFSSYVTHAMIGDNAIIPSEGARNREDPGMEVAAEYLSRYTFRSAITDQRIRSCDSDEVRFEYKDYRNGGKKAIMKLSVEEFIRRFLLHILPEHFSKTRYGGFLASSVKSKNLRLIRELLDQKEPDNPTKGLKGAQLAKYFYGADFMLCPNCRHPMESLGRADLSTAARIIRDRISSLQRASP